MVAFILAFGVETTNLSRNDLLMAVLIGSAIMVPIQFLFSDFSDRNGRKGIFMAGAVLTGLWAFALFPLIDTGSFYLVILGVSGGLMFLGMMYGPQAAFFAELFSTDVRYSGASLGISNRSNYWWFVCPNNSNTLYGKIMIFFGYQFILLLHL